jgi:hypothetical protein
MVLLLTFLILSNSLVEELSKTDLILNLLFTYFLSSFTFFNWTNTMKNNQLGLKSGFLLTLSTSFIILGRLLPVISVTFAASLQPAQEFASLDGSLLEQTKNKSIIYPLNKNDILTPTLSILLPIFFQWIIVICFCIFTVQTFHKVSTFDRVMHLLFNSFLPFPLRTLDTKKQRSKSREIIFTLVFLGLENIATVYLGLPTGDISWSFIPGTIAVFSTGLHCAGCVILWRYYRTTHTWSGLINTDLCGDWWKRG